MVPLIIDTDPGIDDAFAIAVAAGSPEAELLAVTTTHGNVDLERTTANACRVLGRLGRDDVPVGRGADRPLVHAAAHRANDVHGDDGLGGAAAGFGPPVAESGVRAVELLASTIVGAAEPPVLVAIGPLTNVAVLFAAHPELEDRLARLVVMGGAVGVGGNVSPAAEFNVWSDPEAAHRVLVGSRVPTTLVPLDLTLRITVGDAWLDSLAGSGPVGAALAATRAPYLRAYRDRLGAPEIPLHDAVAMLEALVPSSVTTMPLAVDVDTSFGPARGTTIADRRGTTPAIRTLDVALEADAEAMRTAIALRACARRVW